ncbi:ATP-binding protein [Desulfobacter latus]|uniref:ATP-binding protein n=1 Tax=Desulfobacter latus TaxID=2292 RepID=A0A850TBI5_9BACT|nr:DUF87 domain-containing protein [Desulfobacter latus]NWH04736.1 ATP-binding protein [Desulfobacter latus]
MPCRLYRNNTQGSRKRLLKTDFVFIKDKILGLKPKAKDSKKTSKPKQINGTPIEVILTGLWYALDEFKKECDSVIFEASPEFPEELTVEKEFQWLLPEIHSYRNLIRLYEQLHKETQNDHFLPFCHIPHYEEIFSVSDPEEANRVFKLGVNNLQVKNLLDAPDIDPNHSGYSCLKDLSYAFGNFIQSCLEKGFFHALSNDWLNVSKEYENTAKNMMGHGTGQGSKSPLLPLFYKAFFILQKPAHGHPFGFWNNYIDSALITGIHPALIEMLRHRDVFLLQSFSAKAEQYLMDRNKQKIPIKTWENICALTTIQYPLFGLISGQDRVLNTQTQSMGVMLHKFGAPEKRGGILSAKMLLKYEAPEDQALSNKALFRSSRESSLITRILEEYVKIHPHAEDGISIAVINIRNIQAIIAGIDQFLEKRLRHRNDSDAPAYYLTLILLTKTGEDHVIAHWLEAWRQRWSGAESDNTHGYYSQCRLSISQRFVSAENEIRDYNNIVSRENYEVDITLLPNFIESGSGGNEFLTMAPYEVDYNNLKYPVVEMPCGNSDDPGAQNRRARIISNRQFKLATVHSEMSAVLKQQIGESHVVRTTGNFEKWVDLIDKIHGKSSWVVCIDPFIDERLIAQYNHTGMAKREIIGFASGLGAHGELNYTVSTEKASLHTIKKGIARQLNRLVGPWEPDHLDIGAHTIVTHARTLAGMSLVRATAPKDEYVRNLIACALVRSALPSQADQSGFLCDELISLDTYRHWFDDADTGSLPDLLRIVACIEDDGIVHISAHLIECKFANHADAHLEKAHDQLQLGLRHLIPTFLPSRSSHQGRHDQRYWWGQLQRLIAGKSKIAHHEYERVMASLEKVLGGYYTIEWHASALVFWKDQIGDQFVIDEQWPFDFDDQNMEMEVVSCGKDLIHSLCCDGDNTALIPIPRTSIIYRYGDGEDEKKSDGIDEKTEQELDGFSLLGNDSENASDTSEYETPPPEDPIGILEDIEGKETISPPDENKNKIPSRVFLGHAISNMTQTDKKIYWEFGHEQLNNRHFLIFGQSGAGKTYAIQSILYELSSLNQNSVILDYTNGFDANQLENEIVETVKPKQYYVADTPLPINPFRKQYNYINGRQSPEKVNNTASRVMSVFGSVYPLGDQQKSALYKAVKEGLQHYDKNMDLEKLIDILEEYSTEKGIKKNAATSLLSRIEPFVDQEPFKGDLPDSWKGFFQDITHRLHIIQMAGCAPDISQLITEFSLVDFYWYCRSNGSKDHPRVMVLDEIQNLNHKLESPLAKFLTEGRKFGISNILATQTIRNLQSEEQDRLFQAAHKLFFKPATPEIDEYAKLLEKTTSEAALKWRERLSTLQKGQCYSVGPVWNKGADKLYENKAYRIQITSLPERIKGNHYD